MIKFNKKILGGIMYILLITIIIFIIIIIFIYNNLINLKNIVDNSKSAIDVYLQQRFDLIPNLIEITKGYMNYEKDILERITTLRRTYKNNKDINSRDELNLQYHHIMTVTENYPELKASEQFLNLEKSLVKIESQLQAARRIYNYDVTKYNTQIKVFPINFIAPILGFKELSLFSLEGEDNVGIEF